MNKEERKKITNHQSTGWPRHDMTSEQWLSCQVQTNKKTTLTYTVDNLNQGDGNNVSQ